MGAKLIPAVAYIRMSGQQQKKSPAEQRSEIAKLRASFLLTCSSAYSASCRSRNRISPNARPITRWPV